MWPRTFQTQHGNKIIMYFIPPPTHAQKGYIQIERSSRNTTPYRQVSFYMGHIAMLFTRLMRSNKFGFGTRRSPDLQASRRVTLNGKHNSEKSRRHSIAADMSINTGFRRTVGTTWQYLLRHDKCREKK